MGGNDAFAAELNTQIDAAEFGPTIAMLAAARSPLLELAAGNEQQSLFRVLLRAHGSLSEFAALAALSVETFNQSSASDAARPAAPTPAPEPAQPTTRAPDHRSVLAPTEQREVTAPARCPS